MLVRTLVINHGSQSTSTLARQVVVMSTLAKDETILLAGFKYRVMPSAILKMPGLWTLMPLNPQT